MTEQLNKFNEKRELIVKALDENFVSWAELANVANMGKSSAWHKFYKTKSFNKQAELIYPAAEYIINKLKQHK